MQFRQNHGGDQRRRRVLIEEGLGDAGLDLEALAPPEAVPSCASADQILPAYTDAAVANHSSAIMAVIPRRRWTLIVLLLSGLAVIAAVQAAYGNQYLWPRGMWASDFAALDVQAPGSLAAWVCSLMLAVAAFQGLQIYRLRRHKTDDYRGRYRVWLWVPMVLFFMATSVATHIHRDLATLVSGLMNMTAPTQGVPFWPLTYCALWTLVSLRLAFEVRDSRGALVSLLLATCCYFTVAFAFLFADLAVAEISEIGYVMATTTIVMSGHLATFFTVATYGRHVYLDSQGILPGGREKSRQTKRENEPGSDFVDQHEDDASGPSTCERPRATVIPMNAVDDGPKSSKSASNPTEKRPSQAKRRNSTEKASPQLTTESEAEPQATSDESGGNRKLSKSERRRLRKQKRREQRRNAA